MYVITHHHSYDEVLLGPIAWNPRYIASVLESDLDLDTRPEILASDEAKIPYDILPNVRVRPVVEVREEINPKIQRHNGPFWAYESNVATATWVAVDKDIDLVKGELKNQLAAVRYQKEVAGTTITIQDTEVWCDTSRENRNQFAQKHALMAENETVNWKFAVGWLTLSKTDVAILVNGIAQYVQSCFDWEATKADEIDACNLLSELDLIVIEEPPLDA